MENRSQKRYVLRFRKIFRKDKYIYYTTLKGNAKLANGISKIEEVKYLWDKFLIILI